MKNRAKPPAVADSLIEDPRDVLLFARKALATRIRQPENRIRRRWCPVAEAGRTVVDLNELFPLAKAWSRQNIHVARDLIRTAFALQGADGALPRRFTPDGPVVEPIRPWPLVAQSALEVWNARPLGDFLNEILPGLRRYGTWVFNAFLSDAARPPAWAGATEAFFPELWDAGVCDLELTVFLLAEAEALLLLEDQAADPDTGLLERWKEQRDRLAAHLETFWNPAVRRYGQRETGGRFVARRTLAEIFPLLWPGLPEERRKIVLASVRRRNPLRTEIGFLTWEHWKDDAGKPPVRAIEQFMALEALVRGGLIRLADMLGRRWRSHYEAYWRRGLTLPMDLTALPRDVDLRPGILSLIPAWPVCLLMASETLASTFEVERTPQRRGMSQRQWAFLSASILGLMLAVLAIIGTLVHGRQTVPISMFETYANLGRAHYDQGDYEKAAQLFQDMRNRVDRPPASLYLLLGNSYFRLGRYEDAISAYRRIPSGEKQSILAFYNQAMALYRLGRNSEAVDLLNRFTTAYREFVPELTQRAEKALNLIQSQELAIAPIGPTDIDAPPQPAPPPSGVPEADAPSAP